MTDSTETKVTTRLLIMYLIAAVLFVTSIKLHVHVDEVHVDEPEVSSASTSAIHFSSVTGGLGTPDQDSEVDISPSGALKSGHYDFNLLVVFLLAILAILVPACICIARLRDIQCRHSRRPYHGEPSLRAPPTIYS